MAGSVVVQACNASYAESRDKKGSQAQGLPGYRVKSYLKIKNQTAGKDPSSSVAECMSSMYEALASNQKEKNKGKAMEEWNRQQLAAVTDTPQQGTEAHKFTLAPECHSASTEPTAHAQTQLQTPFREKPSSAFDLPTALDEILTTPLTLFLGGHSMAAWAPSGR